MASGDVVAVVGSPTGPASSYAQFDILAGAASPAESLPVLDFDDTAIEYMDFLCRLEEYGGGGLTVTWDWSSSAATSNATRWGAAIRRINDDAEDIDSTAHSYDFNDTDDTAPSAIGERSRVSIAFTDGADMDSLSDGESFILRVRRNATHANDNMSGDAEMWYDTLLIKET